MSSLSSHTSPAAPAVTLVNAPAANSIPASRYLVFAVVALGLCAVDLWTKSWTFGWLGMPGQSPTYWIIEGYVGIQTSLNQGALFGLGQGMVWFFAAASVVAAIVILYWLFVAGAAQQWHMTIALGLVMSGILGNLYDRLGLWSSSEQPIYAVRDWILLQYGEYVWPNFNIADSALVCGVAILLWFAWFPGKSSAGA